MANIRFSLTEQLVINPVFWLRAAPLDTLKEPLSIPGRIGHFFESEVAARIVAFATSFFAVIDGCVHFGSGVIKGGQLALRKMRVCCFASPPKGEEVASHFRQSAKFAGVAMVGSIAAVVWPGVLKHFRVPPAVGLKDVIAASEKFFFFVWGETRVDWNQTSNTMHELRYQSGEQFESEWKAASLAERCQFVHLIDKDSESDDKRTDVLEFIYKKAGASGKDSAEVKEWPSQQKRAFYHATSKLKGILKSGKVEVRHEKAYRGAFVSTRAETDFGPYILVFKRNIERLSDLNHGFFVKGENGENVYWAGFSDDIPVDKMTLKEVWVYDDVCDVSILKQKCERWTGREIKVKRLKEDFPKSATIPSEWPSDDPNAIAIQNTMRIRAQQCAQKNKQAAVKEKKKLPKQPIPC